MHHDTTKRANFTAFLAVLLVTIAAGLWMVAPYLLAVLFGSILAILAHPVFVRLRALRVGPRLSAVLTTLLFLALIVAPVAGLAMTAFRQGVVLGKQLSEVGELSPRSIGRAVVKWEPVRKILPDPVQANARLRSLVQSAGQRAVIIILAITRQIPLFLIQLTLALLSMYFFLLDGRRCSAWLLRLSALEDDVQKKLAKTFHDASVSSVMAGLAAAGTQSACILTGYLLLGIPGAFLAAGVTFFCAWIPVLGSLPASLAGVIYLYVADSHAKMAAMIVIGVLTSVSDNAVRPMVLKGRSELHPLVGLLAVIGGVDLFGLMGLFAGPILATILIALLDIWPEIAERQGVAIEAGTKK